MSRLPQVAVVGFPNAGKSTLTNRLAGGREAVEHPEPGVTRDRKEVECEWNGVRFALVDTGGVDLAAGDEISRAVQGQAREAIASADAILLVVDARAGPGPGDAELGALLRGAAQPVIVVANKVDRPADRHLEAELHGLGLGVPQSVSATHGLGTGDLLDRIVSSLAPGLPVAEPGEEPAAVPSIAIVGRPNVGKSSLLNRFLGAERTIVSELAGTTRDAVDVELEHNGRRLVLVDTAGLRRRTRVAGSVAYYAQLRTERAAGRADVALLICDAGDGVTSEDLRIGELAMRSGCATLVALNKWDLTRTDLEHARARLAKRMRLRPPVITCSALSGRNIPKLLDAAIELADARARRVPTPELNRFLGEAVTRRPPPQKGRRRLRLYYIAQVGERPPWFSVQVNDRRLISREWAFYLENRLREEYGWEGVPLVIDFVPRQRHRGRRASEPARI